MWGLGFRVTKVNAHGKQIDAIDRTDRRVIKCKDFDDALVGNALTVPAAHLHDDSS